MRWGLPAPRVPGGNPSRSPVRLPGPDDLDCRQRAAILSPGGIPARRQHGEPSASSRAPRRNGPGGRDRFRSLASQSSIHSYRPMVALADRLSEGPPRLCAAVRTPPNRPCNCQVQPDRRGVSELPPFPHRDRSGDGGRVENPPPRRVSTAGRDRVRKNADARLPTPPHSTHPFARDASGSRESLCTSSGDALGEASMGTTRTGERGRGLVSPRPRRRWMGTSPPAGCRGHDLGVLRPAQRVRGARGAGSARPVGGVSRDPKPRFDLPPLPRPPKVAKTQRASPSFLGEAQ